MLERTIEGLANAGIREIAILTYHKEEKIKEVLSTRGARGPHITFVHQERLLGTADALRSCEKWLKGESSFLVIHGDDYYSKRGIAKFLAAVDGLDDQAVATADSDDPSRFGSLEIDRGAVVSIHEKVTSNGPAKVNAALYHLSSSIFRILKSVRPSARGEYELTDAVNQSIRTGNSLRAIPLAKNDWHGVTYPWDLLIANQIELQNMNRSRGKGGVERGASIAGPVAIGKGATIKSGSYIEGPAVIGENSLIGPNSYIRPFTSIGSNCKVGAGCEVKASILMNNSHVPHLSYVGDSILGEGCSLGAGTITANLRFDDSSVLSMVRGELVNSRRRKLGAILGDGVRTGINVSIFPGVKLGAGARIWPGVSVRRDVPRGATVRENA